VIFILANDIKTVVNRSTKPPANVLLLADTFEWAQFKDWHRREMQETLHQSIKRGFVVDREFVAWMYRSSIVLGKELDRLLCLE